MLTNCVQIRGMLNIQQEDVLNDYIICISPLNCITIRIIGSGKVETDSPKHLRGACVRSDNEFLFILLLPVSWCRVATCNSISQQWTPINVWSNAFDLRNQKFLFLEMNLYWKGVLWRGSRWWFCYFVEEAFTWNAFRLSFYVNLI